MNFKHKICFVVGFLCTAAVIYFVNERKEMNVEIKEVRASHILVDSEPRANEILEEIQSSKISFEDAARMYSMCPSGRNSGDLGFFKKGVMVREFEDVAFSINSGEISKPIQTQFGWHLIKVVEKR